MLYVENRLQEKLPSPAGGYYNMYHLPSSKISMRFPVLS